MHTHCIHKYTAAQYTKTFWIRIWNKCRSKIKRA